MKRLAKLTSLVIVVLCATLTAGCYTYRDMPIKWNDEQGGKIAAAFERDFTIPNDPVTKREGVYHSGWAYRRGGVWNTGSTIAIYGVRDKGVQDRIIKRTTELVKAKGYWDVRIIFFEDARYEQKGNVTRRIDVAKLRSERIIGKTESWRNGDLQR